MQQQPRQPVLGLKPEPVPRLLQTHLTSGPQQRATSCPAHSSAPQKPENVDDAGLLCVCVMPRAHTPLNLSPVWRPSPLKTFRWTPKAHEHIPKCRASYHSISVNGVEP